MLKKKKQKKKNQVLVSICRRMSKASFIFIFKENQRKCWYFLLMSTHHLVHIHACCIIPTVQISLSFPGFSVSRSFTHQHLATDFDTSPPSKSFISWLSLLSNFFILPKNSWISSTNWSIKLLPLNSFS